MHVELALGRGISVGYNAVAMLMQRAGLAGLPGARRPRSKHQTPTAGDLVERSFARTEPNRLWVTDIERHEAPLDREEVKGLLRETVAAV